MIDTHAHLYFDSYNSDRREVIVRSLLKLDAVVNVGVDEKTSRQAIELAHRYDPFYASVGVHPSEVESHSNVDWVQKLADDERVVAIGEVGLDYHWLDPTGEIEEVKNLQKEIFRKQIEIANAKNLPIIIHSRDAFEDTLAILLDYKGAVTGVWHSFTENYECMCTVINVGLYVGVNGIVTYNSAKKLKDAVSRVDISKVILETDSPFLPPHPHRGERNEPVMVELVAGEVATLQKRTVGEVISKTDGNAHRLFGM